ncbi:MAG TPA: hypothetical protein VIH80_03490, partial [Steroidobacteraceae bacterium]
TDGTEAILVTGSHRALHVFLDAFLEAHRWMQAGKRGCAPLKDQRAGRAKSRDTRFMCRLTAAAFLRFRSWVGFS